jgi:hypothetical protein
MRYRNCSRNMPGVCDRFGDLGAFSVIAKGRCATLRDQPSAPPEPTRGVTPATSTERYSRERRWPDVARLIKPIHESRDQRSSSASRRGGMGRSRSRLPIPAPTSAGSGPLEASWTLGKSRGLRAGTGRKPYSAAHIKAGQAASTGRPRPSARRASGYTDRPGGPESVRQTSVDTATCRSAALQGDT